METDARTSKRRGHERGRVLYRLTSEQTLKMIELGIIGDDEDVELWDGVLYKRVKGELHNYVVSQVATLLRAVMPPQGYHVREEKSSKYGAASLPEPDVAVCRGRLGDSYPDPPDLASMALLVEVAHRTLKTDEGRKLRRYVEAGVPVYWLVDAKARQVRVHGEPEGRGRDARYRVVTAYQAGALVPIVIDGLPLGDAAVSGLFPPADR